MTVYERELIAVDRRLTDLINELTERLIAAKDNVSVLMQRLTAAETTVNDLTVRLNSAEGRVDEEANYVREQLPRKADKSSRSHYPGGDETQWIGFPDV